LVIHHRTNLQSFSNILGPGVSNDEKADTYQDQFEYFSFNDHTIIAFVEGPQRMDSESANRIITRDITGRYAWDLNLFYRTCIKPSAIEDANGCRSSESSLQDVSDIAEGLKLRDGLTLSNVPRLPKRPTPAPAPQQSEMPAWSATNDNSDILETLLSYIGGNNPDCLLDPSTPLNAPLPLSQPHSNIVMSMSEQLNHHLEFEKHSTPDQIIDV
jgi:hypothetical protein